MSKKLDRYLTRREKYMYERILAQCGTSGDFKRLQQSLIILQKLVRRKRHEKDKKNAEKYREYAQMEALMLQMAGERVKKDLKKAQNKARRASAHYIDYDDMTQTILRGDEAQEKKPEELTNDVHERRS